MAAVKASSIFNAEICSAIKEAGGLGCEDDEILINLERTRSWDAGEQSVMEIYFWSPIDEDTGNQWDSFLAYFINGAFSHIA